MQKSPLKDDLTFKINGAAIKIHGRLGNGFQEVTYQRCLALELQKQGLGFVREEEMPIYYEEVQLGTRRADFMVENKVLVELKAIILSENLHLAQAHNYLQACQVDIGLLINFGSASWILNGFIGRPILPIPKSEKL